MVNNIKVNTISEIDAWKSLNIVTLSTKDSASLAKQLNEGFERSVYWNSYETKPQK